MILQLTVLHEMCKFFILTYVSVNYIGDFIELKALSYSRDVILSLCVLHFVLIVNEMRGFYFDPSLFVVINQFRFPRECAPKLECFGSNNNACL